MAYTDQVILSHLVDGNNFKSIQEITDTTFFKDGSKVSTSKHRAGFIAPGFLLNSDLPEAIDGTIYNITDTSPFSSDVQNLAIACWSQEIHTSYEEKLRN